MGIRPPRQIPNPKMKTPRYRVFKSSTVPVFSTNWKFLANTTLVTSARIMPEEKFVGDKYQAILEIDYASVITNN